MKTSQKGIELIASFEGLSLKPYLCPADVPTIGYGATFYEDGTKVTMADKPITKERAIELLQKHVITFEKEVNKVVKVSLTQNQYDAIISLVFNIGAAAFAKSTLLRLTNASKFSEVPAQFLRWNRAAGEISKGLIKRRRVEANLFMQ